MKKGIKLELYLVAMLLCVICIANATKIVLFFSGSQCFQEIHFNDAEWGDAVTRGFIDSFDALDDLLERVVISGWGFSETTSDNANRECSLIFVGAQKSYQYTFYYSKEYMDNYSSAVLRGPAIAAELGLDIRNPAVGFIGEFSTVGIEDGLYQIFIACWENDIDSGLFDTGCLLEKKHGEVLFYRSGERQPDKVPVLIEKNVTATETVQASSWIDLIENVNNNLNIVGWALVQGQDSATQTLYLEILDCGKQTVYVADSLYERPGFDEIFGDSCYLRSGFTAVVPDSYLQGGTLRARLLVEHGEEVWASASYSITKTADGFAIIQDN